MSGSGSVWQTEINHNVSLSVVDFDRINEIPEAMSHSQD